MNSFPANMFSKILHTELNLNVLSKNRTQLMGIGAIFVLICHSIQHVSFQPIIMYVISYCNIGVDIFLFTSGMGLFYSLTKLNINQQYNIKKIIKWYTYRYIRIIIPYLLIMVSLETYTQLVWGGGVQ